MNFIEFLRESNFSDELVGKKLFGDYLNIGEPDTKKEKEIFRSIYNYIRDEKNRIKPGILKTLIKLKDDFPTILKSPVGMYAYRGTAFKPEDIIITGKEKEIKMGDISYYICKAKYKSNNSSQSWTTNFDTATGFFKGGGDPNKIQGILKITIKDADFLFNPMFLNKISLDELGTMEDEVIRITNKTINADVYINDYKYEKLKSMQ